MLEAAEFKKLLMPGKRVPEWFDHWSRGQSISLWFRLKLPLFYVWLQNGAGDPFGVAIVTINGVNIEWSHYCYELDLEDDMTVAHQYVFHEPLMISETHVFRENNWNHLEIFADYSEKIGIYVNKKASNMKDISFMHPRKRPKSNDFLTSLELNGYNNPLCDIQHRLMNMQLLDDNLNWDPVSMLCDQGYNKRGKWLSLGPSWQEPMALDDVKNRASSSSVSSSAYDRDIIGSNQGHKNINGSGWLSLHSCCESPWLDDDVNTASRSTSHQGVEREPCVTSMNKKEAKVNKKIKLEEHYAMPEYWTREYEGKPETSDIDTQHPESETEPISCLVNLLCLSWGSFVSFMENLCFLNGDMRQRDH